MDIKKVLLIVGALVVGYFAVKLAFALIGLAWTFLSYTLIAVLTVGVAYALYRGFNRMLTSGKRLT